jgi:triosephosphate isomerase
MRKKMVAANWKMYTTPETAIELASGIKAVCSAGSQEPEVLICPPLTSLTQVVAELAGSPVLVGGQNMHWEDEGAYTGEVSGRMLLTAGCSHVILGHSERRQLFFETDLTVNAKLKQALAVGLVPVVCVGETLEQRQAEQTEAVVSEQVLGAFADIEAEAFARAIIAYEPVWAIGTGRTASPDQAQAVHKLIRDKLTGKYGDLLEQTRILYGGSVKPDNAVELFAQPDIDGGLVGGASLKVSSFAEIIAAARA